MKIAYLDNAATSFPKPENVYKAVNYALRNCSGNPGRSSHKPAMESSELIYKTRESIAELFEADAAERVTFTLNATHAINAALRGLPNHNGTILISDMEHNAVLRTVNALCDKFGCDYSVFTTYKDSTGKTVRSAKELMNKKCICVVMTAASNVDGRILPYAEIAEECSKRKIPFILDASQLAGHKKISISKENITVLCAPGHKGLFGPMGCGIMILGNNGEEFFPSIYGGNGTNSMELDMGSTLPEKYEAGTLPVASIAGLGAGVQFIKNVGFSEIERVSQSLIDKTLNILEKYPDITLYHKYGGSPVVSITHRSISSGKLEEFLASEGICCRSGLHCAPLAHHTLGTINRGGTLRISLTCLTPQESLYNLNRALKKIVI